MPWRLTQLKLGVGPRLSLSYGAVVSLLLAVILVGIAKLQALSNTTDEALNGQYQKTILVTQVTNDLGIITRAMLNALVLTDQTELQGQLGHIDAARDSMYNALEQLEKTVTDETGIDLLAHIKTVHSAYIVNQEDFVHLVRSNRMGEARNLVLVDLYLDQNSYFEYLEKLRAHETALMAQASLQVGQHYNTARNLMVLLSLVAVLLSIAITLLISRWLLGKLGGEPDYAAEVAARIAGGDLTSTIITKDKDRSSLLYVLKDMRDRLVERSDALHNSNHALADTVQALGKANAAQENAAQNLRKLGVIGRELTANLDVDAIYVTLGRHLGSLISFDTFGIALWAESGEHLERVYCVEDGALLPRQILPDDHAITKWLRGVQDGLLWFDGPEGQSVASSVFQPLIANGQIIGAVWVQSRSAQAYLDFDIEVIGSAAAYAAVALANATTYHQVQSARTEATQALSDLRTAQAQLIFSEKMASLGQLVASVAHEINTPIGAIKSSGGSIVDALGHTLQSLPRVLLRLAAAEQDLFLRLIACAAAPVAGVSTREERATRRAVEQQLQQAGVDDAAHRAAILVQLHAQESITDYLVLLRHPQAAFILETAANVGSIVRSAHNINVAVERVSKIVFALKAFSRTNSSGEMVDADVAEGFDTVLTIYHNQIKHGVELVRQFDPLPALRCFPDELNQVWTNLVHNALQAMNYQGTLTVCLRREGDHAVVSVGDTGSGIPEAIRDKIFDPFFTTKPTGEGSGLGLDIVKKIVDKHKGRIAFQSTVGVGTRFDVYLPYTT